MELGGDGATISDAVDICYMLGMACGSSAMIFAMHQIQVVILLRHARESPWHQQLLRRFCDEQLLFASSTTENQMGGAVRSSACAVERDGDAISLVKNATVMSYGAEADGMLMTARRAPDAQPSDQVLVVLLKGDYELEKIKEWDTMGMRGTSSTGYTLRAHAAVGADHSRVVRAHSPAEHGADRAPHVERSVVRHRGWRGSARASLRPKGRRRRECRPSGAGRLASHTRDDVAAYASRKHPCRCGKLRKRCRRIRAARGDRFPGGMNLLKVNSSELRDPDRAECTAGVRSVGLSQRRRIQRRAQSARRAVVVDHDQQRTYSRQHGELAAALRRPCSGERLDNAHGSSIHGAPRRHHVDDTAADGGEWCPGRTACLRRRDRRPNATDHECRPASAEVLRFPPVMSRALLEKSGYLKSFPHLLGCVSSTDGNETKIRALVEGQS